MLRGNNDFDGIRAVVSRWKDHPALFAWYLADEPQGCGDTPEVLETTYDAIKEIDALRPMLTGGEYVVAQYPQVQEGIRYQF